MGSYPIYEDQIFLFLILFSPAHYLFLITLVLGLFISICARSWFRAWIGLELNLLSFVPLISSKNNRYSSEAALKYFLIQALGSSILLISTIIILIKIHIFSLFLLITLLLKIGSAPFHFWFPPTLEGIIWPQAFILITIQKIAPMSLLSYYILEQPKLIFISIILSAIVGALGGLNQTFLRKIIAYSSINHIAWIIISLIIRETLWLIYFSIYSFISITVILIFYFTQTYHLNHFINQIINNPILKVNLLIRFLSLGGLPPFVGFIPKWLVIQQLSRSNNSIILFILLASSLLTLFYYLRITLRTLIFNSNKIKWMIKFNLNHKLLILISTINFSGILILSIVYLILV